MESPAAPKRSSALTTIGIALLIVAILFVVVGIMYFTIAGKDLPGFLGTVNGTYKNNHRAKRGAASLVAAAVCFIGAAITLRRRSPSA